MGWFVCCCLLDPCKKVTTTKSCNRTVAEKRACGVASDLRIHADPNLPRSRQPLLATGAFIFGRLSWRPRWLTHFSPPPVIHPFAAVCVTRQLQRIDPIVCRGSCSVENLDIPTKRGDRLE